MATTLAVLSDHVPDRWFTAHPVRVIRRPDGAVFSPAPVSAGICAQIAYLPALLERVDGIVLATCCDQQRRAAEWLANTERVFLVNVPSTANAEQLRAYEKARLARWLDALCVRTPLDAAVEEMPLPRVEPHSAEPKIGVVGGHFLGSIPQTNAFFKAKGLSLVWWGCEGGQCLGNVYARPNDAFYQNVRDYVRLHQISGLVVVHTTWCDLWRLAAIRLREVLDVPVTTWIVDDASPLMLHAQACTRLEAFCERILSRAQELP